MGFRWFYIFGVTEGLSALCRKGLDLRFHSRRE